MSLIGPWNILAGASNLTGYTIDQSLRFEESDSAKLSRVQGAGNRKTWTFSCWFKRGNLATAADTDRPGLMGVPEVGGSILGDGFRFINSDDRLQFMIAGGSYSVVTTQVFRDVSAWYHFVCVSDTTQATASDRMKFYVNGAHVTDMAGSSYPTQNYESDGIGNSGYTMTVGQGLVSTDYWDGYEADVHFIDGTAYDADDFGETNEDTNQWIPKKATGLTYGTNGFYLKFEDSADLGNDSSGNGNDLTVANLVATDQVKDTPTNNFCTFNPLIGYGSTGARIGYTTFTEGNLLATGNYASETGIAPGTFSFGSGKWYVEFVATSLSGAYPHLGIIETTSCTAQGGYATNSVMYKADGGKVQNSTNTGGVGDSWIAGDVIGMAIDCTNGAVYFAKNNTWQNSGVPTSGATRTGAFMTWTGESIDFVTTTSPYTTSAGSVMNCGQDSSFAGEKTAQGNGGAGFDFYYTPPADYLALCTSNLSDPSIVFPAEHWGAVLYSGNSSTQSVTGVGFSPDFTWMKSRNTTDSHELFDVVRGPLQHLESNDTGAEATLANSLTSFDADGFSLGNAGQVNATSSNYASWNWLAGGTPTATNVATTGVMTSGSVFQNGVSNTSFTPADGTYPDKISANTTNGFSIVNGPTTGSATQYAHGLSQAPEFIIAKSMDKTDYWPVGATVMQANWGKYLVFNSAGGFGTAAGIWNNTAPTADVFTIGTENAFNNAGQNTIFYCIHSVDGYSKVGLYTGNVNADGTFTYLGFRPAMVMIKGNYSSDWHIFSNKLLGYNVKNYDLTPSETNVEITDARIDFLSNGFKIRTNTANINSGGSLLLYYAIAESPFKYASAR